MRDMIGKSNPFSIFNYIKPDGKYTLLEEKKMKFLRFERICGFCSTTEAVTQGWELVFLCSVNL